MEDVKIHTWRLIINSAALGEACVWLHRHWQWSSNSIWVIHLSSLPSSHPPNPSIHLSIHPHLISTLSEQRDCRSAQRVCAPLLVCVCVLVYVHVCQGSSCMSWPSPACRFMLLIGCMCRYTIASHDWSHTAQLVMVRAVNSTWEDRGSNRGNGRILQ